MSCGSLLPGFSVCSDTTVGELRVRGPSLSSGYHGRPELTATRFRDGAFSTGDLGFVHDDQLYVIARTDDRLIVGGRNVDVARSRARDRGGPARQAGQLCGDRSAHGRCPADRPRGRGRPGDRASGSYAESARSPPGDSDSGSTTSSYWPGASFRRRRAAKPSDTGADSSPWMSSPATPGARHHERRWTDAYQRYPSRRPADYVRLSG